MVDFAGSPKPDVLDQSISRLYVPWIEAATVGNNCHYLGVNFWSQHNSIPYPNIYHIGFTAPERFSSPLRKHSNRG